MSYRYYGGTRDRSGKEMLADLKWVETHCPEKLGESAAKEKFVFLSLLAACGFMLFGIIALVVWGINNLAQTESFVAIISNPLFLLLVFPFLGAGVVWLKLK